MEGEGAWGGELGLGQGREGDGGGSAIANLLFISFFLVIFLLFSFWFDLFLTYIILDFFFMKYTLSLCLLLLLLHFASSLLPFFPSPHHPTTFFFVFLFIISNDSVCVTIGVILPNDKNHIDNYRLRGSDNIS